MYEYYRNLPDYLPDDELLNHFDALLEAFKTREIDFGDFIESLRELSIRWWHNYSVLEPELRTSIDLLVSAIMKTDEWRGADLLICRSTMSIIGNLGLSESYGMLKSSFVQALSKEKQQEAKGLVNQIGKYQGGRIEDPYAEPNET
jgi:hypothetical protein